VVGEGGIVSGVEYWLARDLQHLLGYAKWSNFLNVVSKAKTACEVSGHEVEDPFADVGKRVDLGSGSTREIDDIGLKKTVSTTTKSMPTICFAWLLRKVSHRCRLEGSPSLLLIM